MFIVCACILFEETVVPSSKQTVSEGDSDDKSLFIRICGKEAFIVCSRLFFFIVKYLKNQP